MTVVTKTVHIKTKGDTDIIDITQKVANAVSAANTANGIVTVFVPGATGGITTVEYEPGLIQDLKRFFEKIEEGYEIANAHIQRNAEYECKTLRITSRLSRDKHQENQTLQWRV